MVFEVHVGVQWQYFQHSFLALSFGISIRSYGHVDTLKSYLYNGNYFLIFVSSTTVGN